MQYWPTDNLLGSEVEVDYGKWEGHQSEWHDRVELGDRVADEFIKQAMEGGEQCRTSQLDVTSTSP